MLYYKEIYYIIPNSKTNPLKYIKNNICRFSLAYKEKPYC
jgi:hypothetical protein